MPPNMDAQARPSNPRGDALEKEKSEASIGGVSVASEEEDPEAHVDDDIKRLPSSEFAEQAALFQAQKVKELKEIEAGKSTRTLLVNNVVDAESKDRGKKSKKKGAFSGVFVPTCENMWGVLIFLRFYTIVGEAGIYRALGAVFLSFSCAFCTTSSMSATVSSGGVVSQGGPYYMISRALGPCVGASVGIMYWLAITMLCVLETLGAVEGLLMISDDLEFTACKQAYGSAMFIMLFLFVYGGINVVTKLGIFFVFVVFSTLFMFYFGLVTCPNTPQAPTLDNPYVTGLSLDTAKVNQHAHYTAGNSFGYVLSIFFPCFTGILSGANRADILRDPPKNLRQGTFGAIIFSLFMYSSYMILWGFVAEYPYLQGQHYPADYDPNATGGRRLAGAGGGTYIIEEIVWNPFPNAAKIGIIVSSLSQALQCLVVAPRLLNAIAKDKILSFLNPLAPLHHGEPKRSLGATYVVGALLVLLGQLDLVAPLLSMCFLVAYAFMNFSCFALTWLKSPAWRPKGIQRRRWRAWYLITSGCGFIICLSIMFTIDPFWALGANFIAVVLYVFVNWKLEAKGWGSAMDGIRFQLALNSLIQLEDSQKFHVNWRPQVLILYRVHLAEELKGIKHHEILRFYSQLRKGNGFCVVACVLEAESSDEHAIHKARIEKDIIKAIMKEEQISGFAEVVVAPSWAEGTNYVIQLTGIGGLVPNTVLLDWPDNWEKFKHKATDFVAVLRTALAEDKAVLAIRGLRDLPADVCYGTIDIWWMIHDGGFLILLSWLLVQHRTWRKCHLRVFTITEGVTEGQAKAAAELLTKTLRQRRLFDVDVEVILADDEMIEPYTYDWTLRVEERHKFLSQLRPGGAGPQNEAIPLEIDDLFQEADTLTKNATPNATAGEEDISPDAAHARGQVHVTDYRTHDGASGTLHSLDGTGPRRPSKQKPTFGEDAKAKEAGSVAKEKESVAGGSTAAQKAEPVEVAKPAEDLDQAVAFERGISATADPGGGLRLPRPASQTPSGAPAELEPPSPKSVKSVDATPSRRAGGPALVSGTPSTPSILGAMVNKAEGSTSPKSKSPVLGASPSPENGAGGKSSGNNERRSSAIHRGNVEAFQRLNQIIHSRSKRAQLVVMNLPDLWGNEPEEVYNFMSYCDQLTKGLDRVLFVHSSGHEIFDISL